VKDCWSWEEVSRDDVSEWVPEQDSDLLEQKRAGTEGMQLSLPLILPKVSTILD
jgi:uncharacterized protein (DUF2344 family)